MLLLTLNGSTMKTSNQVVIDTNILVALVDGWINGMPEQKLSVKPLGLKMPGSSILILLLMRLSAYWLAGPWSKGVPDKRFSASLIP